MAQQQLLVLDSRIRDWVLIPVFVVMFLFGVLRHYVMLLLKPSPAAAKKQSMAVSPASPAGNTVSAAHQERMDKFRRAQLLIRARALRENAHVVPREAFARRRHLLCNERDGLLREEVPSAMSLSSMADPSNMLEMMKGNFATIIPNVVMLGWVSYFFTGFVIAKFPFPLTGRFRGMVQRGVENIQSLDVTYVTSASIYFLILFGLRGLLSLVLGENAADDAQLMQQQQQQMMSMGGAGGPDMGKLFTQERENIELIKYDASVQHQQDRQVEERLLERWSSSNSRRRRWR